MIQDKKLENLLNQGRVQLILLAGITIFAAALRFYKLGEWSLWIDEVLELNRAKAIFDTSPWPSITKILINLITTNQGTEEWSARLAAALVGIVSIPILYFSTKRLFGPAVALLTATLLAVSPWHIYWSQHVRFYTVLLLLYTLGLFFFLYSLETDQLRFTIFSAILLIFATHERAIAFFYVPVILAVVLALWLLRIEKPAGFRLRNILIPLAVPIAVWLIWDLVRADQWLRIEELPDRDVNPTVEGFSQVTVLLGQFLFDARLNPIWMVLSIVNYIGLPIVVYSAFTGLVSLLSKSRSGIYMVMGAAVPLLALTALAFISFSNDRYVFQTLPFWLVLAAVGVVQLYKSTNPYGKILTLGVVTILLSTSLLQDVQYYKYQGGHRHDWKGAFAFVKQSIHEDDLIVASFPRLGEYYLGMEIDDSDTMSRDVLKMGRRIWFVDGLWGPPTTNEWLRERSELVSVHDVQTPFRNLILRVYLYDPGT